MYIRCANRRIAAQIYGTSNGSHKNSVTRSSIIYLLLVFGWIALCSHVNSIGGFFSPSFNVHMQINCLSISIALFLLRQLLLPSTPARFEWARVLWETQIWRHILWWTIPFETTLRDTDWLRFILNIYGWTISMIPNNDGIEVNQHHYLYHEMSDVVEICTYDNDMNLIRMGVRGYTLFIIIQHACMGDCHSIAFWVGGFFFFFVS